MSQQHSTFKWQKKSSIQTLQKLIFHANIFRKKLTDFQREILARKKKVGHYLHLWNTLFHPVLLQIRKSRKRKEKLHHFFMKRREKSFPLVLKLLPTSLCFVSWHWRHIIQELGTNIKKGEKTDRVDSPSRKEILKASNVWNTSDKKITFLQSYCAFLPLFPLSSPISCLFLFQRTIASEMCGSNSNPKVKPVLSYFPAPSPLLMRGVRELLMLGTELLGHKKKERKPQRILPLRFLTVLFVLHIPTELRAISPICAQHRNSHQRLAESGNVHKAETPEHWHSPCWNHLWVHSFCATWGLMTLNTCNKLSAWSLHTAVLINQTCSTLPKCRKAK